MFKINCCIKLIVVPVLLFLSAVIPVNAQVERFLPAQGGATELWRITNDPSLRHWANYHNKDAWSPDGRYLCYVSYEPFDVDRQEKVFIYDLHKEAETEVSAGSEPRWANNHNWLLFVKPASEKGEEQVMWLDVDSGKLTRLCSGVSRLGDTDFKDRWIYGYNATGTKFAVRIPIRENSRPEILEGMTGFQWNGNPAHPVLFSREDHRDANGQDLPFAPTRIWCDPAGNNVTIGSPMIQRCHESWSGDGEYLLHGNSLMKGRKWDEPFPSNLHVLSVIPTGDISACGKSGRWICGSGNSGPLRIADLRSGDGRKYLEAALSYIHDSYLYSYNHGSALHDNDAKGSADGTKIVFVTNYDLKDGPVTTITEDAEPSTDIIKVESTNGFPESGTLSIGNEIVKYDHKSPTSFEGLTRNFYKTSGQNLDFEWQIEEIRDEFINRNSDEEFIKKYNLRSFEKIRSIVENESRPIKKGLIITSFDARLIPEKLRKNKKLPSFFESDNFPGDKNSPLIWQNRTDIYVAIVRLPDQPHFTKTGPANLELIPGENHWETYAYNIFLDGKKINKKPVLPGVTFRLEKPGRYSASAVEWSGLESEESFPVQIDEASDLKIRTDKPADFSWTSEKWLVDNKEVSRDKAMKSPRSVREINHLVEGTIHREWYNWGQITERHDLNSHGDAIRRLSYLNGKLAKREYFDQGKYLLHTELFDEDGKYITEGILYKANEGKPEEIRHFWYEKGCPVKFAGSGGRHASKNGPGIYEKEGDAWVQKK